MIILIHPVLLDVKLSDWHIYLSYLLIIINDCKFAINTNLYKYACNSNYSSIRDAPAHAAVFDRISTVVISLRRGTNSNEFRSVRPRCELSFCPWSSFVLILRYSDTRGSEDRTEFLRLTELYGETATGSCSQGCNTDGRPLNEHCYTIHDVGARLHFISEITTWLWGELCRERVEMCDRCKTDFSFFSKLLYKLQKYSAIYIIIFRHASEVLPLF